MLFPELLEEVDFWEECIDSKLILTLMLIY